MFSKAFRLLFNFNSYTHSSDVKVQTIYSCTPTEHWCCVCFCSSFLESPDRKSLRLIKTSKRQMLLFELFPIGNFKGRLLYRYSNLRHYKWFYVPTVQEICNYICGWKCCSLTVVLKCLSCPLCSEREGRPPPWRGVTRNEWWHLLWIQVSRTPAPQRKLQCQSVLRKWHFLSPGNALCCSNINLTTIC